MIGRFFVACALVLCFALARASGADIPDSPMLEKELQRLSWPRFRFVVESLPKLRAEVDRHGQFGWQFVRANYRTYPWKKNIDKLDADQRRQLALLIRKATTTGGTVGR